MIRLVCVSILEKDKNGFSFFGQIFALKTEKHF